MNFFSDNTLEVIVNAMMRNFGGLPQEIIKEHMIKQPKFKKFIKNY
jgi:hypothetical protein